MADRGSQPHPRSSAVRVSTKSKAPSPPGLKQLDPPGFSQWYPGNPHLTMDHKENAMDRDLSLLVVLPDGVEKMTTVHGSTPLMDLLVVLCAQNHLNPSSYTLELVTAGRRNIKLKANTLIGTLDAEKIILKAKGEDKNKKAGPHMPEATVRMVINYKKSQKTILRVNPRVPLAQLLPAICEKCEFDVETTVLLKDVRSLGPLDLTSSLDDYAIREVYARDTKGQPASPACPPPASPTPAGAVPPGKDKNLKEKENKGLFSMFRRKKTSEKATTASAPASPVLGTRPRPLSMALPRSDSTGFSSPISPGDGPKKRRAPQPPILVSQSCPTDLGTRRRLYSEPTGRLDSEQMAGLSRGSSAESSLKRTKRKAPPPPTSPPAVVQDTIPLTEKVQGGTAANTLEEIMEQEETIASVKSATARETLGDNSSASAVSLHSPSPDTEILSTMSVEGADGDDQSVDLSSDGNQLLRTMIDSVSLSDVMTTAGTDSSDLTDDNPGLRPVESVDQLPASDRTDTVEDPCSTVSQDGGEPASLQANPETLQEPTDDSESSLAPGTSRPTGEDAQVQTDFTPIPASPRQHVDQPSSDHKKTKDMATLTEELDPTDLKRALSNTTETSSRHNSAPCALPEVKAPSPYATESEPKPKPSNELTRDYIPKVGMTTYTIVPQKSLEKLRYFEVAVTLESPAAAPESSFNTGSLQPGDVSEARWAPPSETPTEELLTSTTTTTATTAPDPVEESSHSLAATSLKDDDKSPQAGSPAEVKEAKSPPATKPKPGSFRLAPHKRTPGYYVTSAADKSPGAGRVSGRVEDQSCGERAKLPPPPLQRQDGPTEVTDVQPGPQKEVKNEVIVRQTCPPSKESSLGLSLEKLRRFAAPRPYSPSTPSRFAQAVSSAVKRSQSMSHGPKSPLSPVSTPLSPITTGVFNIVSGGFEDKESSVVTDDSDGESRGNDGR